MKPLAVLLAAGLLAAGADEAATRPPRPASDVVDATLRCYAIHGRNGSLTGTVDISVNVGADGRSSAVMSPPDTAEHLAAAAQCVGVLLRWQPALQDDVPVAGKVELTVTFPSLPTIKGELRKVLDYCHAPWTADELRHGTGDLAPKVGSVDMVAQIGTDGKIKDYRLPAGALPWMTDAAKCVADRLEFYPAVLRTSLVESSVVLPLDFNLTEEQHYDAEVTPPTLRSSEDAILAAYRHCYPAEKSTVARIEYRITVAKTGRVRKAELLQSSGDPALDEAGICILKNLAFVAARRGGIAVESTLNWPILVRPPG